MRLTGFYWDGRTSERVPAVLVVHADRSVTVCKMEADAPLCRSGWEALEVYPRLGNAIRRLEFPDGAAFETEDNDAVDRVQAAFNEGFAARLVHLFESRLRWVLLALGLAVLLAVGGVRYGVPWAARMIAFQLPQELMEETSKRTLDLLDRGVLKPSELSGATRSRLQARFAPLKREYPELELKFLFRKGGRFGPNAFALPDGTLLMTDELVTLAADDAELESVMAHEAGHVALRHGMRTVIQNSILAFGLLAITGDASGVSELVLGAPVFLTQLAYSRGFEIEADRFALDWLIREGIAPMHFANLMRRLERKGAQDEEKEDSPQWRDYLSTHPMTEERILPFLDESVTE